LASTSIMLKGFDAWEEAGIRRDHQIAARIVHEALSVGILSLWPVVVMVGLGASISASTFFTMWAYVWLFMSVFGYIITALFRSLPPGPANAIHSVFLIVNLVSSGAITPIELMHPFFRIGYGLPFHNAVAGLRAILFSSGRNTLPRNIGVLFAWLGACQLLAMYKFIRERRKVIEGRVDCTQFSVVGS
jgi:uncharacterized phage infection (PIP) family protein YhgE